MKSHLYDALNAIPGAVGAGALVWLCLRNGPPTCDTVALYAVGFATLLGAAGTMILNPRRA